MSFFENESAGNIKKSFFTVLYQHNGQGQGSAKIVDQRLVFSFQQIVNEVYCRVCFIICIGVLKDLSINWRVVGGCCEL